MGVRRLFAIGLLVACGGSTDPGERRAPTCGELADPCGGAPCSVEAVGDGARCSLFAYSCGMVTGLATNDGRWCVYSKGPTCSDPWVRECSGR